MLNRRDALIVGAALTFGPTGAHAQESVTPRRFQNGFYLPLMTSDDGSPSDQSAAFLGDERRALHQSATLLPATAFGPAARAEDAITRIVADASGRRVVILNEAHTASRHRMFLIQLLRALKPLGFTHLAAEAFINGRGLPPKFDVRSFRPGAPFQWDFGHYTRDPVFAEAMREAAELGYRLLPYEQRADQNQADSKDRKAGIAEREEAQAGNFIEALNTLPSDARVLVFVGYNHLRKSPDADGNEWFALRLRRKAGVEALTVAQAVTGSFGPHAPDGPLTRAVLDRFAPRWPVVVTDGGRVVGAEREGADLAVFHPALPDVDGRPGWLAADSARRRAPVVLPRGGWRGPALLQGVRADDPDPAVPADQQLLPYGAREAVLFLRPGPYRLRLETLDGHRRLGSVAL